MEEDEMMASPNHHVDNFLAPIDPRGTFTRIMEAVVMRTKEDPGAERAVRAMMDWLAKPLISNEAEAALQSHDIIGRDVPDPFLIGSPAMRFGLSLAYLRTQEALRTLAASGRPVVQTILDQLPHVAERLGKLEPDFLSALLLETHSRAAEDPRFAERLRHALVEVQSVHAQASAWASVLLSRPGTIALTAKCHLSGGWYGCGVALAWVVLLVVVVVAVK
jgi:hypothetical protein